jgi:hypothetical protein
VISLLGGGGSSGGGFLGCSSGGHFNKIINYLKKYKEKRERRKK